jgi:hypothetical protein
MSSLVGGYVMVDCKGLDLGDLSKVDGLYKKVSDALETNKPIALYNIVNGDQEFKPIIAFGGRESVGSVFLSFYPITIHIDYQDNVTM